MNQILFGDCREMMSKWIGDGVKAQMCVTSPPYFGLRDYGTATWEGGMSDCDHKVFLGGHGPASVKQVTSGGTQKYWAKGKCPMCGAIRVDEQIGLEKTPDEYVKTMVETFRLVRDVLEDDGTLWLNLGDTYANPGSGGHGKTGGLDKSTLSSPAPFSACPVKRTIPPGLKQKDLIGIPWRVAFALQADGWYLRQDIIWAKPNPMPESVTDRCTKSHEYLFLLSKSSKYYFDSEAVAEPVAASTVARLSQPTLEFQVGSDRVPGKTNGNMKAVGGKETRNRRSVWTINTKPYKGAHFATFPPALIEPCILAGSKPGDIVLDPFMGSGTTAQVALQHGRQYLGCELNSEYKELQDRRVASVLPLEQAA